MGEYDDMYRPTYDERLSRSEAETEELRKKLATRPVAAVRFQVTREEWRELDIYGLGDVCLAKLNAILARRLASVGPQPKAFVGVEAATWLLREYSHGVSVPRGEGPRNYVHKLFHEQVCDQLRAELEKTRGELAEVKASWETCRDANDRGAAEHTRLRAELDKTRAELAHQTKRAVDTALALHERGDELEKTRGELEACAPTPRERDAIERCMCHDPDVDIVLAYAERIRAILKPAPAVSNRITHREALDYLAQRYSEPERCGPWSPQGLLKFLVELGVIKS